MDDVNSDDEWEFTPSQERALGLVSTRPDWDRLPDEIIREVFRQGRLDRSALCLVSRRWRRIVNELRRTWRRRDRWVLNDTPTRVLDFPMSPLGDIINMVRLRHRGLVLEINFRGYDDQYHPISYLLQPDGRFIQLRYSGMLAGAHKGRLVCISYNTIEVSMPNYEIHRLDRIMAHAVLDVPGCAHSGIYFYGRERAGSIPMIPPFLEEQQMGLFRVGTSDTGQVQTLELVGPSFTWREVDSLVVSSTYAFVIQYGKMRCIDWDTHAFVDIEHDVTKIVHDSMVGAVGNVLFCVDGTRIVSINGVTREIMERELPDNLHEGEIASNQHDMLVVYKGQHFAEIYAWDLSCSRIVTTPERIHTMTITSNGTVIAASTGRVFIYGG